MDIDSPSSEELPIMANRGNNCRSMSVDSADFGAPIYIDEWQLSHPGGTPPPPEAIHKPKPKAQFVHRMSPLATAKRVELQTIVATMGTNYEQVDQESINAATNRLRSCSVDSADFGAPIYIDEWELSHPGGTPPPPEAIHKPKLQVAPTSAVVSKRRRSPSPSPAIATSARNHDISNVAHDSNTHATQQVIVSEPVQQSVYTDAFQFAQHLARCVMKDMPLPEGHLTIKQKAILQRLKLVLPQRSPVGKSDDTLTNKNWQGGFAHVPEHKFCEMCVDARDLPWYTYDQKMKLINAHFHSPLLDFEQLEKNRAKARQLVISAGALCSKYRYETNNQLFVKLSDCVGSVILDHDMLNHLDQQLITRQQNILPHNAPFQVMIQDSHSDKKYLLAQFVLLHSEVYKKEIIDARRIFYLDGNPFNCKLDNLLVLSQHRVSVKLQTHPFGIHNLMIDNRHSEYATKDALWLRNTWCVPAGKVLNKKVEHSLQACSQIKTRQDLFDFCSRYNWNIQYNSNIMFRCEQPFGNRHPMYQYSAILTAVKAFVVSDIILAILGETPRSLYGKDKSKQLQCTDSCWMT